MALKIYKSEESATNKWWLTIWYWSFSSSEFISSYMIQLDQKHRKANLICFFLM